MESHEKLRQDLEASLGIKVAPTRMDLMEGLLKLYAKGKPGHKLQITLNNMCYFPDLLNNWQAEQGGLNGIQGPIKDVLLYLRERGIDAIALEQDRLAINYTNLPQGMEPETVFKKLKRDLPMYRYSPSLGGGEDNFAILITEK